MSLCIFNDTISTTYIFFSNSMFARNNFWGKLFFGTALVFCLSVFWGGSARAALYATYADVSNTSTFGAMPTWEILQIYKMPIRGRINSIQIKANGVDGGGTSMLRAGLCRATDNVAKAGCVGSYVWSNENPYISRGLKWYNYTFPDTLFDKDAYVKLYFDKGGSRLFWQEYAIKAPSSTYADGVTWIVGSSYTPEQNFDMQVLLDITPCNDAFSGHVFNTSTGEAVAGAGVRMMLSGFSATVESCEAFLTAYASRGDVFCHPDEGAGLRTLTDSVGYFNFLAPEEVGSNFTVQTSAEDFATTTVPYSEIYTNNGACYNPISHDFYLEPVIKRTPIVIVPGILGSFLYKGIDEEVWPNIPLMLLPGDDSYLDKLMLGSDGISGASDVYHGDIMRSVLGQDYFEGLITELQNSGYVEGKDLFVFPYDWRLDIAVSSNLLKNKINEIKEGSGMAKVDIVAHSMGGLVAKKYIEDYGQNSVDKFIDIATPHLGAPKAAKILMYGDNLDIRLVDLTFVDTAILNPFEIKKISQNMPAIYQLLPSREYLNTTDAIYSSYIADMDDVDHNGVSGSLNYDESAQLLQNSGRNGYLMDTNDALHNQIDNFDPTEYGVRAYNIIGCRQPTIGKIYILNKETSGYEYRIKYISGDGTVPLRSAEGLNNIESKYYTVGAEHSKMPSFTGIKELIVGIAQDNEDSFNFIEYSNIREDTTACNLNGYIVSFHSPINLHVYDENNNHLGPNANGDIEMGIAGASYDIIDGNKFAFLPKGHTYRVVGQATDAGTFNARIQDIQNNETVETQYFNRIPLNSTSTNVEYNLEETTENVVIQVDQDGDSVFENVVAPSAVLDQNESLDTTKPQTTASLDGSLGQNDWYISDAKLALNSLDGEDGSGVLKTEYSLDGGVLWQEYLSPVIFSNDGRYTVQYRSIDKAGNIENTNEVVFKVDRTNPEANMFSPINETEYLRSDNIVPVFDVTDGLSGVATDSIMISFDGELVNTSPINLFDYTLGPHSLVVSASDLAGNSVSTTANFLITTNIDSTLSDIGVIYGRGWINEKANKQLVNDLNAIKRQIEKFGLKKIAIDTKFTKAMEKCVAKKGATWCEAKLKPRLAKTEYTINKIYKLIISMQYRLILTDLNQYQKKSWINESAYNLLKENINYLINELE